MYVLGLHLDGNYFKVCVLSKKGKEVRIEFLKEFNKDVADLSGLKASLDKKKKLFDSPLEVVSALSQGEVFVRKMEVPFIREKDVHKAVEAKISFEDGEEEEVYHLTRLQKGKGSTNATVYSFAKKNLEEHYAFIENLGISAEHVTSVEAALERFGQFCGVKDAPYFHFHLGWESSSLYFFEKGKLVEGSFFSFGFKEVVEAVQKDHLLLEEVEVEGVQKLFLQSLREAKEGVVHETFVKLKHSLARVRGYIERKVEVPGETKVLFSGYAEFSRLLKGEIEEISKKEFIPHHKDFSPLELSAYAIEIGLALDRTEKGEGVQLSVEPCLSTGKKKSRKKRAARLLLQGMASALLFVGTAFLVVTQKEVGLEKRYQKAFALIKKHTGKKHLARDNKALLTAVKQKEKEAQAMMGPIPFYTLSNWFTSFLGEGEMFDAIEYRAIPKGAELELIFSGANAKFRANNCMQELSRQEDFSLDGEVLLEESGDRVELKVKLTS